MSDKMREEFEAKWGFTNEEQGLRFIQELNVYGCDLCDNAEIASSKSSAWYYWQASRAAIEIDLPFINDPYDMDAAWANEGARRVIEAAGLKVKS